MNTVSVLLALTMVFAALAAVAGSVELAGGQAGDGAPIRTLYVNSLGGATAGALLLAALRADWMLLLLAMLAGYLLLSAARNRRAAERSRRSAAPADWAGAVLLLAGYAALAAAGLAQLPRGAATAPMALVLGGVAAVVAVRDLESWLLPDIRPEEWLRRYRIRAASAQISVFALACVVDLALLAPPVRWAFPALGALALATGLLRRLALTTGTRRGAH
ncbi:MAG TPA: hypothetical protein VFA86_12690 [Gammaproteobacteria bacterium]|nr:hypothetical protein [Gammaproteobacteria bacterium]